MLLNVYLISTNVLNKKYSKFLAGHVRAHLSSPGSAKSRVDYVV